MEGMMLKLKFQYFGYLMRRVDSLEKKKQKAAIEKVKQQHRREIIRKDIRRQRVERYKRENRNG